MVVLVVNPADADLYQGANVEFSRYVPEGSLPLPISESLIQQGMREVLALGRRDFAAA